MNRSLLLVLGVCFAAPVCAQDLIPLDAAPRGEVISGRLGQVGETTHPLYLHAGGERLLLKGWPADMARLARLTRSLRDLVGQELVVEARRVVEDGQRVLRLVRLVSPTFFEPQEGVVSADGKTIRLGEDTVTFEGSVAGLLRQKAKGRVVQVAGFAFRRGEQLRSVYLTRVQAYVDWKMAWLSNAQDDLIGFVPPRSQVWLLGTSEDGLRAFTRDGWQLKPQFPETGLPWFAYISHRVDRYAPVSRFKIGAKPTAQPTTKGLADGVGQRQE